MLWIKALHIISVIAWMAGLLYLPRLFVYHSESKTNTVQSETFKVMERRLYRAIMTPAMVLSWIFGLLLIHMTGMVVEAWLVLKILLVVGLTTVHVMLGRHRVAFERDANMRSAKYFRILNEVPTLLMIGIVILVVLKPF